MFDNPSKYQYEDCCTHYNESGYDFGYGALKVSLNGMSVVIDDDCMGKRGWQEAYTEENYKYLILRLDCKLYSAWDDPASLIF